MSSQTERRGNDKAAGGDKNSIRSQITILMLVVALCGLFILAAVNLVQLWSAQKEMVKTAQLLEQGTTQISSAAMEQQVLDELATKAKSSALRSDEHLESIQQYNYMMAQAATRIYDFPNEYVPRTPEFYDPSKMGSMTSELLLAEGVRLEGALLAEVAMMYNITDLQIDILSSDADIPITYFATETGAVILSETVNVGRPEFLDARERPWYKRIKESRQASWTEPFVDYFSDDLVIVHAVPVYHQSKLVGVVGIGGKLDALEEIVMDISSSDEGELGTTAFILDKKGQMILGPEVTRAEDGGTEKNDLFDSPEMSNVLSRMLHGEPGVERVQYSGRDSYLAFYPIEQTGWTMVLVTDANEAMATVLETKQHIRDTTQEAVDSLQTTTLSTVFILLAIFLAVAGITILISNYLALRITEPLRILSLGVAEMGSGNLNVSFEDEKTNDEIGALADAFEEMQHDLKLHINESARLDAVSRAKSEFLSRMSHEIRTPMNAIIGMTKIASKTDDVDRLKNCIDTIESSSVQLLGIVNDVLDYSKIEAGKIDLEIAPMSLEHLLRQTAAIFAGQLDEKRQTLKFRLADDMHLWYLADELRLAQVLNNLMSNAIKFTPEEGAITIAVEEGEPEGEERTLRFAVSDTGIGMSREQISRLFQSFEQADSSITRRFGGTGLGLSICKGIVEKMGGTIWASAKPGRGSTFTFDLRLTRTEPQDDSRDDDELSESSETYDLSKVTLLLAEDVEINRIVFTTLLEETGIKVDTAENGVVAFNMFRDNPSRYDVIIMDVQMPEMDGLEATRSIRALPITEAMDIPIIAMTANVMREDVEDCLEAGMNDHLAKPIDIAELIKKLRDFLPHLINSDMEENGDV